MLNALSESAGARVIVHDPNSVPLPDEFGINLQPNTATAVAVQKVTTTKDAICQSKSCGK